MSRPRQIAAWTLQILLAVLFLFQAWMKLSGSPNWITRFRNWGYPEHFYLIVGGVEFLGAIALLAPRFTRSGVGILLTVMVGAAATHLLHHEPQFATTLVIIALLSLVLYLRRGPSEKGTGN